MPWRRLLTLTVGVAAMSISGLSLLGHWLHQSRFYQWSDSYVGMALNTACAIFVLGLERFTIAIFGRNDQL